MTWNITVLLDITVTTRTAVEVDKEKQVFSVSHAILLLL